MIYNSELGIYVNKVEDLRDKVSEEMYATIEYLTKEDNEIVELKKEHKALEEEFECYEARLDEVHSLISEITNNIEELQDYIYDSNRITRHKILDYLNHINYLIDCY